jgi:hypothetical protein
MNLYLILDNKERGVFILKNKASGELKEIWVDLDYDLVEYAVSRAEKINEYVKKNEVPEEGINDENICSQCGFYHLCLPPVERQSIEFQEGEEILAMLERYEYLKPLVKEFEELKEELKQRFEGKSALIGDFHITGKWIERKEYVVPAGRYWKMEIKKLK